MIDTVLTNVCSDSPFWTLDARLLLSFMLLISSIGIALLAGECAFLDRFAYATILLFLGASMIALSLYVTLSWIH